MNLQQLQYLVKIHQARLNISEAARSLGVSQSGLSRQMKDLEEELGVLLFDRSGRALRCTTVAGDEVISRARIVLRELDNIRDTSANHLAAEAGDLAIATTHTQARYVMAGFLPAFRARYPLVKLHLHQGSSEQIAEMVEKSLVDMAIATDSKELFPHLVHLPAYRWHQAVVAPRGHPLTRRGRLTLADIAQYPIVTYEFSLAGRDSLVTLFRNSGHAIDVALTAQDADVIKTYVRVGLGIGVMAPFALDAERDGDLVVLNGDHLFAEHETWIGYRRNRVLRTYAYDFIEGFAPHLRRSLVRRTEVKLLQSDVDELLRGVRVPRRGASFPLTHRRTHE